MSRANLSEANLSDAKLEGVYLRATNCTGATLQGAQLFGAILTNTLFTGANLNNIQANPSDFAGLDLVFLANVTIDVATVQRLSLPVSLIGNQQGSSYRVPIVKREA